MTLRRWTVQDAPALHALILDNLDHLRPYMHWIAHEPQTLEQRRVLIERWTAEGAAGGNLTCGIWRHNQLAGAAGLHRRIGPHGLKIGYWIDRHHLRQGIATAASRALTDLAFTVPGINQVQISHDASNHASAGIPTRLGYQRLSNQPRATPTGTNGTDTDSRWTTTRGQWPISTNPIA